MLSWRRPPYWAIYLALVAIVVMATLLLQSDALAEAKNDLKAPGETTIDVVKTMITLVTTLNTTMLGSAAALALKSKDWSSAWARVDGTLTIGAFLSGAVSYYGVYWAYVALLDMIDNGVMSATSPLLQRGLAMQYYGTLVGFLLIGLVFVRLMEGRLPPKS